MLPGRQSKPTPVENKGLPVQNKKKSKKEETESESESEEESPKRKRKRRSKSTQNPKPAEAEIIEENGETYLEFPINGYRLKLVDIEGYSSIDPVVGVSINVENLQHAEDYYVNVLKMNKFPSISQSSSLLGYDDNQAKIELTQIGEKIGVDMACHAEFFTANDDVFKRCVENIRVGILNRNYGSSGAEAGENFGGEGRTGNCRQLGPGMFRHYARYINSIISPTHSEIVHAQGVKIKT